MQKNRVAHSINFTRTRGNGIKIKSVSNLASFLLVCFVFFSILNLLIRPHFFFSNDVIWLMLAYSANASIIFSVSLFLMLFIYLFLFSMYNFCSVSTALVLFPSSISDQTIIVFTGIFSKCSIFSWLFSGLPTGYPEWIQNGVWESSRRSWDKGARLVNLSSWLHYYSIIFEVHVKFVGSFSKERFIFQEIVLATSVL